MKMKQKKYMFTSVVVAFLFGIFCMGSISHLASSPATSHAANIREKQVITVMVEKEDTIWTIAERYYTDECGSMKDYIKEIKQCNSLTDDTIYAGFPLIIPVWLSETEMTAMLDTLNP